VLYADDVGHAHFAEMAEPIFQHSHGEPLKVTQAMKKSFEDNGYVFVK